MPSNISPEASPSNQRITLLDLNNISQTKLQLLEQHQLHIQAPGRNQLSQNTWCLLLHLPSINPLENLPQQIKDTLNKLPLGTQITIAGDFNHDLDGKLISILANAGLEPIAIATGPQIQKTRGDLESNQQLHKTNKETIESKTHILTVTKAFNPIDLQDDDDSDTDSYESETNTTLAEQLENKWMIAFANAKKTRGPSKNFPYSSGTDHAAVISASGDMLLLPGLEGLDVSTPYQSSMSLNGSLKELLSKLDLASPTTHSLNEALDPYFENLGVAFRYKQRAVDILAQFNISASKTTNMETLLSDLKEHITQCSTQSEAWVQNSLALLTELDLKNTTDTAQNLLCSILLKGQKKLLTSEQGLKKIKQKPYKLASFILASAIEPGGCAFEIAPYGHGFNIKKDISDKERFLYNQEPKHPQNWRDQDQFKKSYLDWMAVLYNHIKAAGNNNQLINPIKCLFFTELTQSKLTSTPIYKKIHDRFIQFINQSYNPNIINKATPEELLTLLDKEIYTFILEATIDQTTLTSNFQEHKDILSFFNHYITNQTNHDHTIEQVLTSHSPQEHECICWLSTTNQSNSTHLKRAKFQVVHNHLVSKKTVEKQALGTINIPKSGGTKHIKNIAKSLRKVFASHNKVVLIGKSKAPLAGLASFAYQLAMFGFEIAAFHQGTPVIKERGGLDINQQPFKAFTKVKSFDNITLEIKRSQLNNQQSLFSENIKILSLNQNNTNALFEYFSQQENTMSSLQHTLQYLQDFQRSEKINAHNKTKFKDLIRSLEIEQRDLSGEIKDTHAALKNHHEFIQNNKTYKLLHGKQNDFSQRLKKLFKQKRLVDRKVYLLKQKMEANDCLQEKINHTRQLFLKKLTSMKPPQIKKDDKKSEKLLTLGTNTSIDSAVTFNHDMSIMFFPGMTLQTTTEAINQDQLPLLARLVVTVAIALSGKTFQESTITRVTNYLQNLKLNTSEKSIAKNDWQAIFQAMMQNITLQAKDLKKIISDSLMDKSIFPLFQNRANKILEQFNLSKTGIKNTIIQQLLSKLKIKNAYSQQYCDQSANVLNDLLNNTQLGESPQHVEKTELQLAIILRDALIQTIEAHAQDFLDAGRLDKIVNLMVSGSHKNGGSILEFIPHSHGFLGCQPEDILKKYQLPHWKNKDNYYFIYLDWLTSIFKQLEHTQNKTKITPANVKDILFDKMHDGKMPIGLAGMIYGRLHTFLTNRYNVHFHEDSDRNKLFIKLNNCIKNEICEFIESIAHKKSNLKIKGKALSEIKRNQIKNKWNDSLKSYVTQHFDLSKKENLPQCVAGKTPSKHSNNSQIWSKHQSATANKDNSTGHTHYDALTLAKGRRPTRS